MPNPERMYIPKQGGRAHYRHEIGRGGRCGAHEVYPLDHFPEYQRAHLAALPMCRRCIREKNPPKKRLRLYETKVELEAILALHQPTSRAGHLPHIQHCGTCWVHYPDDDGGPATYPADYPCPTAAAVTKLKEAL